MRTAYVFLDIFQSFTVFSNKLKPLLIATLFLYRRISFLSRLIFKNVFRMHSCQIQDIAQEQIHFYSFTYFILHLSCLEVINFLLKESFQRSQFLPILIYLRFYIFQDFIYQCLNLGGPFCESLSLDKIFFAFAVVVVAVVTMCVIQIFVLI